MGKQSTLRDRCFLIISKDPDGLKNIEYDFKLMMLLVNMAPHSTMLYKNLNKIEYDVEQRRNINLELELRKAVMTHYFN